VEFLKLLLELQSYNNVLIVFGGLIYSLTYRLLVTLTARNARNSTIPGSDS